MNRFWWLLLVPVALVLAQQWWAIEKRDRAQRARLEAFRGPIRDDGLPVGVSWTHHLGTLLGPIVGVVEQKRLRKLLRAAGVKDHASLTTFIAMKAITSTVLIGAGWLLLEWRHIAILWIFRIALLGVAFLVGWRIPDLILKRLVRSRHLRLEQGMPDALDLLVICAEAGLSLNQAIDEISRQLRMSNKDVADEFGVTSAEMRVLPDFGRALDNFVERTQLLQMRSLIATLKQSLQFGTPLAESLRLIASEMRSERNARMEERAARLPVLLAVPMMAFILPCLMMIIGTPVVLRMIDVFKSLTLGR